VCCLGVVHAPVQFTRCTLPPFPHAPVFSMHGFGGDICFQSSFIWIVRIHKSDLMSLEEVQKRGGGRPHFVYEIGSEIVGLLCSKHH